MNEEPVERVSHGGAASVVVESESAEVLRESVSVIFYDSTATVSWEVIIISEGRSTVTIDGGDAPLMCLERI